MFGSYNQDSLQSIIPNCNQTKKHIHKHQLSLCTCKLSLQWYLFCLSVLSLSGILNSFADAIITIEGQQSLTNSRHSKSFSKWAFSPHPLWHETSVYNGISQGPVTPVNQLLVVRSCHNLFLRTLVCRPWPEIEPRSLGF